MILFTLDKFLPEKEKFAITCNHENSWGFYTAQYEKVLNVLNEQGLKFHYQLNPRSYAYMFLLRHYCELKLKSAILKESRDVPITHAFSELLSLLSDVPEGLIAAIEEINLDEDGSCYRYFYGNDGEVGPLYGKVKEMQPFYEYISTIPAESSVKMNLGLTPVFHKRLRWELTFHFNEVNYPGVLRTQYDYLTEFFIAGIISEDFNVNEVYLPLLFLIRHSLELALKENLSDLLHTTDEQQQRKINRLITREHKLARLFNKYTELLPVDRIYELTLEMQEQYHNYMAQVDNLKELLHRLDANSRYFRYPYDPITEHLHISRDILIDIITDFLTVDGFITFNVDVLKENNLIPYSEREIERMMGFNGFE